MSDFPRMGEQLQTLPMNGDITGVASRLDEHLMDRLSLNKSRQRLSENTRRRYKIVIRHYNRFLESNRLSVSQESLVRYFHEISKTHRPGTLNLYKSALLKCVKAQMGVHYQLTSWRFGVS